MDYPDQRVIQTRRRLSEALIELLHVDPIEKITVSQLTYLAGIDRTTFYNHYSSIYHLIEQMMDTVIDDLIKSYRYPYKNKNVFRIQEIDPKDIKVFSCVKENDNFFICMFGSSLNTYFEGKLVHAMIQVAKEDYRLQMKHIDHELYATFHAYAIYGLITRWVEMEFQESEEYMIDQLITILKQSSSSTFIKKRS